MKDDGPGADPLQSAGYGPPGYGPPPGGSGPGGSGPGGFGPGGSGPGGWRPPPGGFGPPPGGFGPPPGGFGPPGAPLAPMGRRFHPLAITSMVLGILSIPTCCCGFLGVPLAIASLVVGTISLGKIRREPEVWKGGGMAIAGIVTAGIAILLAVGALFTTFDDSLRTRYMGSSHYL